MCRTGGRRCESHWTQAQRDADNARRRAAYAAKKGNAINTLPVNSVAQQTAESLPVDSFGVKSTMNDHLEGESKDFYTADTLSGRIDRSELHADSFWEYGFNDPDEYITYNPQYNDSGDFNMGDPDLEKEAADKSVRNSNMETVDLTYDERAAFNIFTSSAYENINRVFFDSPRAETFEEDTDPPASKFELRSHPWNDTKVQAKISAFNMISDNSTRIAKMREADEQEDGEKAETENEFISTSIQSRLNTHVYTEHSMREYTETFDRAFTKASGEQRIVYRGAGFSHQRFIDSNLSVSEYMEQEYPVGVKKSMRGAQSTTMNKETAHHYAGGMDDPGILYEIRTASGVNISAMSCYQEEHEVILPRNTQYIVVGSRTITLENGVKKGIVQMIEVDDNDSIRTKDNLRTEFGEINYERLRPKKEAA